MINQAKFFTSVRSDLFNNTLTTVQVNSMVAIMNAWQQWSVLNFDLNPNIRWLAYMLATVLRECGSNMVPIRECGLGKGHVYGISDPITHLIYYGRGYVQLTWKPNYQELGKAIGVDLEHYPDMALEPANAAQIMFCGMATGRFTGRRLSQYFGSDQANDNPVAARHIINGQDHAQEIATNYAHFKLALS